MKKAVFALPLLVLLVFRTNADQIDISLRLNKGDSYKVKVVSTSNIEQSIEGQTFDVESEMVTIATQTVDSVFDDGTYLISMKYDSLHEETKSTSMPYLNEFGEDAASEMINEVLVGKKFYFRLTPKWKIVDISGVDEIMQGVIGAVLDQEEYKDQALELYPVIEEFLSQIVSEEALVEMFQHVSGAFPDEPVAVGSKWDQSVSLNLGMAAMDVVTHYSLEEISAERIVLDFKSRVSKSDDIPTINLGPAEMKLSMEGEQNGKMVLDPVTFWPVKTTLEQDLAGDAEMVIPGMEGTGGMKIPMSTKTKTIMTTVE
ncbi:DUF6263 family protein [Chitinispirillales bacterium ANBcel5]|uniref:DUF6263 family protein n=1 Tax=Cellulosispirillum alkaliphilum TaxID=3039283 RepID=UPI002A5779D2|nr:DUF6263 family protein [Chitinispirillales bacterium ANBcel5]